MFEKKKFKSPKYFIKTFYILKNMKVASYRFVELLLTAENCEGKNETLNWIKNNFKFLLDLTLFSFRSYKISVSWNLMRSPMRLAVF